MYERKKEKVAENDKSDHVESWIFLIDGRHTPNFANVFSFSALFCHFTTSCSTNSRALPPLAELFDLLMAVLDDTTADRQVCVALEV